MVAAYGLVNVNAKWQLHINDTLLSLGFMQCAHVTHLFYRKSCCDLNLVAVKHFDDILFGGSKEVGI